jgi:hypothetical protein
MSTTSSYGGVTGATLYSFTDDFGTFNDISITDELLAAYGSYEAARRDIERKAREKRGMAHGGIIPEHVIGFGQRSGRMYEFAERGMERVLSNKDSREYASLRSRANNLAPSGGNDHEPYGAPYVDRSSRTYVMPPSKREIERIERERENSLRMRQTFRGRG